MDKNIESAIKIISEYLPESVFQNCLKRNYFFAPLTLISKSRRNVLILIDTTKEMPTTFDDLSRQCVELYGKIVEAKPVNYYLH